MRLMLLSRHKMIMLTSGLLGIIVAAGIIGLVGRSGSKDNLPTNIETKPVETAKTPTSSAPSATPDVPPSPSLPGDILDLTGWKLTLPIDSNNEIFQPELSKFQLRPYFYINDKKDGVVFRAHAGGDTTKNSEYPRSELREMTGSGRAEAAWSNTSGTHTMTISQAITHLPTVKPQIVAGQIHDSKDDVVMVRLHGSRLFVERDGKEAGVLDTGYTLGKVFTVKFEASNGRIRIFYNGSKRFDEEIAGKGYYFKAGCYTQSNTAKGDDSQAYGEVIIYGLLITHT